MSKLILTFLVVLPFALGVKQPAVAHSQNQDTQKNEVCDGPIFKATEVTKGPAAEARRNIDISSR